MATYADNYENAFPYDSDIVVLEHADSTARSSFRVCNLCGALVLDSLHVTHVRNQHPGNE